MFRTATEKLNYICLIQKIYRHSCREEGKQNKYIKILRYRQRRKVADWEWKSIIMHVSKSFRILKFKPFLFFTVFWVSLSRDTVKTVFAFQIFPAIHSFWTSPHFRKAFREQLRLATTQELPLVVHKGSACGRRHLRPRSYFSIIGGGISLSSFYKQGNSLRSSNLLPQGTSTRNTFKAGLTTYY